MADNRDVFLGDGFQGDKDYLNSDYDAGRPAEIRLLENILALGGGTGVGQLATKAPAMARGAYGVLKGLGNAGEVALGTSAEGVAGAKAVNKGLQALSTPEEMAEIAAATTQMPQKAVFGPELVNELKEAIKSTPVKGEMTLSNGSKWRLDGIQKGFGKAPDNPLLEHIEGPMPATMQGATKSTTLSTLDAAAGYPTPLMATDVAAQRALGMAEETGGATMNLSKGSLAGTPHYAVSVYPERELILKGEPTTKAIQSYMEKNKDLLANSKNSFGIWKDSESGKTYLDIVVTTADQKEATALGLAKGQKAIFDLGNMKEIRLGEGL